MNSSSAPVLKDLVLIGGGHSHVTVLKRFGMEPMPGVRLTVISRDVDAPYSGMLPGLIAGHYTFDKAHIDLGPLARFAGARFFHDEVVGIDSVAKLISCRDRPPVTYDVVSINIGSTPGLRVPGAAESVVPVKPIAGFWRRWEELRNRVLSAEGREDIRIGVVGGGAGGVEILLAIQYRLQHLLQERHQRADRLSYSLATMTKEILPTHNHRVRAKFRRVLAERDVDVLTGRRVVAVNRIQQTAGADGEAASGADGEDADGRPGYLVRFADGEALELDEVLWVTTARAADWPGGSGMEVDERGFIKVNDALQSLSSPDIFAVGDVADVVNHPRPKAGVFAVRQGPPLTDNLRLCLLGEEVVPFRPQQEFLSLVSTGDKCAVASRGEWALEGRWVWKWKDFIDQRFMNKYNLLPEMEDDDDEPQPEVDVRLVPDSLVSSGSDEAARWEALEKISTVAMRCGGCGSKVGSTVLEQALERLEPLARDDVVVGLDAPDDAAVVEVPAGKQLVQTVDFFRSFIDDPYAFGKVAAQHALGDVFAMGAEPQTALAMVTIPFGIEEKVEADLTHLLFGALEVLNAENTALVGGHTSEGAELALGFAVNGLIASGTALSKAGMNPGDKLILTKPLGTGALFAADMRLQAKGRWIEAALRSMTQSSRGAASCLVEQGATAMTDVTGFGLLGHLVEMAKASGVEVDLELDAIPALDGALEVIGRGIFSSLQPQNVRLRRAVANVDAAATHAAYSLIFDPQTAGGMLASVPAESAGRCLDALRELGYGRSAVVGCVGEESAFEEAIRLIV